MTLKVELIEHNFISKMRGLKCYPLSIFTVVKNVKKQFIAFVVLQERIKCEEGI